MRILYLHQYFNTPSMSGGTRSYEIARRLVQAGHEVDMVTSWRRRDGARGWRTSVEEGVRVHWLAVPYSNNMGFTARVCAFISFASRATARAVSVDADVIFATSTPLTIVVPAIIASRIKRRPFVFEVRDMWPEVPIALGAITNPLLIAMSRWLERLAYRNATTIVALAPGMRADIVAKGIPAEKVLVIPNGCDLRLYSHVAAGDDIRASHSWLGRRKLVLYAGTIGRANGVEYLVKLAAEVAVIDPEVRFVLIGDGAERVRMEQLALELGVLRQSLYILPPLPKQELVPWLLAADIHVALMKGPEVYVKDAVNNKFFDALAAGKPIANNFDGWQSKIAEEADIGIQLDPDDLGAATLELVRALDDSAWRVDAGHRARKLARGQFNYDGLAMQVEQALSAALKKTRNVQRAD